MSCIEIVGLVLLLVNLVDLRYLKWWDWLVLGLTLFSPVALSMASGKPMVLLLHLLEHANSVVPVHLILPFTAHFVVLIFCDGHHSVFVARRGLRYGSAECELVNKPFSL
jgi:hypothetical protein